MKIDKSKPVMLTGATGYVAGQLAKKLLEEGFIVHAPVRNPKDEEKTKYLDAIAANSKGSIKYFKADLLEQGSYDKAAAGCEVIFHTASPFTLTIKDPQKDLVDPALLGTENVLNTANKTESVKRVVLTSSCAAIYGDSIDFLNYPNNTLTEEQWNTTSSLTQSPYSYSKVLAEKKAWEMAQDQSCWDLVVINPSFVFGPGINPHGTSESYNVMKQMGTGAMMLGCPDMNIGCVDVRDVAEAHFRAAFTPEAKGRYVTSGENLSFLGLADMLRPKYGAKYPLPKKNMPQWLIMLIGPFFRLSKQMLKANLGYPWKADNSKIKKDLNFKFRPISVAVNEFFAQLIEAGVLKNKGV
jgi:nucleoside-diphosphate-sugar epimerase